MNVNVNFILQTRTTLHTCEMINVTLLRYFYVMLCDVTHLFDGSAGGPDEGDGVLVYIRDGDGRH